MTTLTQAIAGSGTDEQAGEQREDQQQGRQGEGPGQPGVGIVVQQLEVEIGPRAGTWR